MDRININELFFDATLNGYFWEAWDEEGNRYTSQIFNLPREALQAMRTNQLEWDK